MKKALLIINAQEDFIGEQRNKKKFDFDDVDELIDNINSRIKLYEKNNDTVVYIANVLPNKLFYKKVFGYSLVGTKGVRFDKRIQIISQNYFEKQFGNAFKNNNLVKFIEENKIKQIEIIGIDSRGCILKTAKGAAKLGINVTISSDSIGIINVEKFAKVSNKLKSIGVVYL